MQVEQKPPPKIHQEIRVLVLGLENSGKTSILRKLSDGSDNDITNVSPTRGFIVSSILNGDLKFTLWDVGGAKDLRRYWYKYFGQKDILVLKHSSITTQSDLFSLFDRFMSLIRRASPRKKMKWSCGGC